MRLGPGNLAILIIGTFVVGLNLWAAAEEFVPHGYYGMRFANRTGRIALVYKAEQAAGRTDVRAGDHVLDLPRGDVWRGIRMFRPQVGDQVRVSTARGTVTITAARFFIPTGTAIVDTAVEITGSILIAFATLLCLRRPGLMSFAFWLWATTNAMHRSDFLASIGELPAVLAIAAYVVNSGSTIAAVALIPFALRFPTGKLDPQARWADVIAWCAFIGGFIAYTLFGTLEVAGLWGDDATSLLIVDFSPLVLLIAGAILVWRYLRSSAVERAQTAWAIAGFIGSILAQVGEQAIYSTPLGGATVTSFGIVSAIVAKALNVIGNVSPLLAIYPIFRYRLFDLGFALNRAALYSTLTLAAVATLAGVNWLAQHLVTERLALIVQPAAAIVIGLGYLRVRAWTQSFLERLLFRERFAAEAHLESTIRGLAAVERPESVDEVLVTEAATTLALSSAALFRLTGDAFTRVAVTGWDDFALQTLRTDDPLARRLIADGPLVRLSAAHWQPDGLPPPPADPVIAFGLFRRGALAGVVFYSRHRNGTEIDPEEVRLLRRLTEAAAIAYDTAEAVSMRAQLARTEARVAELTLELRYARQESHPA